MVKTKNFTHLFYQTHGFGRVLPCIIHNIRDSLLKASFAQHITFIAPTRRYIVENYCACEGALTHS